MANEQSNDADTRHPFLLSVQEVEARFKTSIDSGLATNQIPALKAEYGTNELKIAGAIRWYTILLKQIFNAMVMVLIFAMSLSFAVKDEIEGSVLIAVITLNASIGFWQEYGAEKKMDALRALSSPSANVLRDGKYRVIPNADVVPGDIVALKMGDTVPADIRVFEAMNLTCDESSLTGEAMPIEKTTANDIMSDKAAGILATSAADVQPADRTNMAYATSTVQKGRGRGIVVATGMKTEVGRIAATTGKKTRKPGRSMNYKKYGKSQPIKGAARRTFDFLGKFLGLTEGTPLQRKLAILSYILFGCALLLAVVVFAVNKFKVPAEVAIYAISCGIAIIPESLVAVLTITMVVATKVMRETNVVVRDLSALEALGGVTNICSDKTGTLTQGAMIVKKAWLPFSKIYTVRDSMDPSNPTAGTVTCPQAEPASEEATRNYDEERSALAIKFDVPEEKPSQSQPQLAETEEPEAEMTPELRMFLLSAALCNLATVRYDEAHDAWKTTGEPTEIALQVFAHRFQLGKKSLEASGWHQVAEFPFDSSIKRMTVVYNAPENNEAGIGTENRIVFTKGAVERVLDLCSHVGTGEAQQAMTDDLKDTVLKQMTDFASQGQRVLAIAYRPYEGIYKADPNTDPEKREGDESVRAALESNLVLLGLAGIYDPPRRETTPAILVCAQAGIKVHMLTGDHPETARAIAREVGIIPSNPEALGQEETATMVMKATDFDRLTDAEIDALEDLPLVVARCAPETKTRMIEALRRRGAFMAMTGDGVNDAPSLSRADVGIAMGSGSDVAKSAAKIVLTDDKFNSIVAAIKEGRRMFDNIQKFVLHLLCSNVGEVILLIAGLAFRDDSGFSVFPISPLEILWINMLTSSFPAFGLGREKAGAEVMRKPPQDKKRGVFSNQILVDMVVYGTLMGTCTLMTFVIVVYGRYNGELGHDCNNSYSESCIPVFRARAAVFAELTWLILISAFEFKSIRRSMFRLNPDSESRFPLFKDLYENKFLFYSVVIGALSVFPTVHIPVLNHNVFKHTAITWEWSVVVGMTIFFVGGVEAWKFIKRTLHLFDEAVVVPGKWSQGEEQSKIRFGKSISFTSIKSWRTGSKARNSTVQPPM
ncbi:hypothetical protein B0T19DRAFT_216404 [Cercophora scortea]|uniref:P-type Na(+) transporter n=1 Tax=Cercophora scortea TaxID=314031 RepID=A0AAE0M9W1_9PEZI|nr:hypothetical protein B0T19DRAFT_216404 [Cercophora scortea]